MYKEMGAMFPPQRLPLSKKDEKWKRRSVDSLISRHKRGDERHQRMKTSYDIMNSIFDLKDLKYVIDPFNVNEGFPAKMQNINLIRPKIEGLKGEFLKRPLEYYAFQTDERAVMSIIEKEKEMLVSAFEASIQMTDDKQMLEYLQNRLNEIRAYVKNRYYSPEEQAAATTLKFLWQYLDIDLTLLKMFEDALIAGEAISFDGILNGDPIFERVNPLTFSYDRDPELRFIEHGEWAGREMLMTLSDIHDRFTGIDSGDLLSDSDFEKLTEQVTKGSGSGSSNKLGQSDTDFQYTTWQNVNALNTSDWVEDNRKGDFVPVYHCVWKSQKKVGYLTFTDEFGEENTDIVDETYVLQEGENIEWEWITEIWEGYKFWEDTYSDIKPIEYQYTSVDHINADQLPYKGAAFNTNNTDGKSLVEIMKPLQYFYLTIFYRLELALARDAGKPIVMDITQIPKSQGFEPDKWLHYLKSVGVVFINPYETGWNIPGREGGKPAAYNQISSVDMTMQNVIGEYVALMDKIERMMSEVTGINEQRQGLIKSNELVGNAQRNIIQSSHITEPTFYIFDKVVKNALTSLLNTTKYAWRKSGKKYLNYVLSGPERLFLEITDDFLYSEHDIFISDSAKQTQDLETIKSLYQPAMQNGASLLDIATIMTSDNISEIKQKLADIQEQQAKMIQEQSQIEQQVAQEERALKQRELDIKEEDSIRNAEVDLQIAAMKNSETNEKESENLDTLKLELQRDKQEKDNTLRSKQLEETTRHNKASEAISRQTKQQKPSK